jgi:hypothetical protein
MFCSYWLSCGNPAIDSVPALARTLNNQNFRLSNYQTMIIGLLIFSAIRPSIVGPLTWQKLLDYPLKEPGKSYRCPAMICAKDNIGILILNLIIFANFIC